MHRLSKTEKETILRTSEADDKYIIFTYNRKLRHRLEKFAEEYPELCRIRTTDCDGAVTYIMDSDRVSIRFIPPYSDKRVRKARELAEKLNRAPGHNT